MGWLTTGIEDGKGTIERAKDELIPLYKRIVELESLIGKEMFLQLVPDREKASKTPEQAIDEVKELILHHVKVNAVEAGLHDEIQEDIQYLVNLAQEATGIKPKRAQSAFDLKPKEEDDEIAKMVERQAADKRLREAYELIQRHESKLLIRK